MPQRLELPLYTPVPRRLPLHQQRERVVQPEHSVDTPMEYNSDDPHPVMFDGHRDRFVVNNPVPCVRSNNLRGTSTSNNPNFTSRPESHGTVFDLDSGAQTQQRYAGMDFGGVSPKSFMFNTLVDSSSSGGHHSLSWQNDTAQAQVQELVAQHGGRQWAFNTNSCCRCPASRTDRGQPVAMVSAGARNGAWHFQQQNGATLGNLFQLDRSDKLLAFDGSATMTSGSPEPQEHLYPHGGPRPESEYPVRRSNWVNNFEQDTQHGNLARRFNELPIFQIQVPVNHVAQPARFPYSYRHDPSFSYRAYLDSLHSNPPHVQPSCTDSRTHQNPLSNRVISLARANDAVPEQFPSCYVVENVLGGAGVSRSVTGPPKSDALATKQNGGKRQGPLGKDARAHAASTRHDGSCWPCKIQRYKCDAKVVSGMCGPCKRSRNPWRFGCKRDTLPSLAKYLLAASLLDQHQPEELSKIISTHTQGWYHDSPIHIHVKWAHGLPIKVGVQEFFPNGNHLLYMDQYILENGAYKREQVASLPIGMTEVLLRQWSPEMHSYLDRTLDAPSFPMFPENCFRGSHNGAQRALIHAISKYNDGSSGERKCILRNSLKLLMCTKLASYTLNLDEDNKKMVLQRLKYHSTSGYGKFTASRFLNREIKHVVADIHRALLDSELHQLQEALQTSDRQREFWGPVLVSMLSLAMVTEIMQHLVQCKALSERAGLDLHDPDYMRRIREIEQRASDEIADMEYVMQFLRDLFSRKYISQDVEKKKGFKPIFKPADRAILDVPSQCFAADLEVIIQRYGDFLGERKQLGPPQGSDNPCISRLVAELLLSCTPRAKPMSRTRVA